MLLHSALKPQQAASISRFLAAKRLIARLKAFHLLAGSRAVVSTPIAPTRQSTRGHGKTSSRAINATQAQKLKKSVRTLTPSLQNVDDAFRKG